MTVAAANCNVATLMNSPSSQLQKMNASFWTGMLPHLPTTNRADREELYYLEEGQFYQTKRKVGAPWGKINRSDSVLGFYVMDHWPALRDDLVKPFRQKPISSNAAAGNQNQNAVDNKAISGQNLTEIGVKSVISKDYSFQYVLFYRNIWVERAFNQKDIDPRWAKENETYTFNQTLKLTKMHQIMDALFLIKPR